MLKRTIMIWLLGLIPIVVGVTAIDYNIRGFTAVGWEFVRELFKDNFVRGRDTGASIAAYHQGKLVFDLSGGWFDQAQTIPYNNNTLQLVYSASKGVVAAAVALCVQQGLLDYSALVTKYWPEFGQNGKQNTTVEDIVSHRAGLPDSAMPFERYLDWTEMTRSLEQQRPVWPPGSAQGYHGLSYGWLAGELVRRVDPKKRTFGKLIHDEIATRLDAELYIGLPEAKESRVSPLVFQNIQNFLGESMSHIYGVFNEERAHQAEIPGANCITNARSMAKMYASLIGDVNGQPGSRLLREDILRQAVKKSKGPANEIDLTVKFPFPFAMGFMLYDQTYPSLGSSVFGHTGASGSMGFGAPAKNLSFSFVTNQFNMDPVTSGLRTSAIINKIVAKINTKP